jgi:integral membrane protein
MIEGVSFLVLLGIAMPLKYIFKLPEGQAIVFWVGLVHGLLFITYATVAFRAYSKGHLSSKLLRLTALASVLPFGPFVLDGKLKTVEQTTPDVAAPQR